MTTRLYVLFTRRLGLAQPMAASTSASRVTLVLGVMTHPARWDLRRAARSSWLGSGLGSHAGPSHGSAAITRFVVGSRVGSSCTKEQLSEAMQEDQQHKDIAFIEAPDCHKGFGAEKVHAWYAHALATWPGAVWYGKMEDDGLLWAASLVRLLEAVPAHVAYVGYLQWQVLRHTRTDPRRARRPTATTSTH